LRRKLSVHTARLLRQQLTASLAGARNSLSRRVALALGVGHLPDDKPPLGNLLGNVLELLLVPLLLP
jgi:hypothetical protein